MAKPVQIINDYWLKETILNGNPDLNKFYKEDLIRMVNVLKSKNQELKNQQKEYIERLEKLAYQNMVPSVFANGCKVAYGIALNRYKEIIGGDSK